MSAATDSDITISRAEVRAFKYLWGNITPQIIAETEIKLAEARMALHQAQVTAAGQERVIDYLETHLIALRTARAALERLP